MIAACKEAVAIPVFVMIRPRGGGFLYSEEERDVMRRDIVVARDIGADGIVIGGMLSDWTVDQQLVMDLVEAARGLPVTFHRAFDFAPNLPAALESLVEAGVDRILTSGAAPTAAEGAAAIADLVRQAGSRLTIIAGGGVRENNVRDLIAVSGVRGGPRAAYTNCKSRTDPVGSGLRLRKPLPETIWPGKRLTNSGCAVRLCLP